MLYFFESGYYTLVGTVLDTEAKQYKIEELKYYYRYYLDEQGVSIIPKLMEAIEKEKVSIRNQCIEIAYDELQEYI